MDFFTVGKKPGYLSKKPLLGMSFFVTYQDILTTNMESNLYPCSVPISVTKLAKIEAPLYIFY